MVIFHSFLAITPVWDLTKTWGFHVDDPYDFLDIPKLPHKKFINQSFNVIIRKDYASFMRNLISETAKSTAYIIAHVNILKEIIN